MTLQMVINRLFPRCLQNYFERRPGAFRRITLAPIVAVPRTTAAKTAAATTLRVRKIGGAQKCTAHEYVHERRQSLA